MCEVEHLFKTTSLIYSEKNIGYLTHAIRLVKYNYNILTENLTESKTIDNIWYRFDDNFIERRAIR